MIKTCMTACLAVICSLTHLQAQTSDGERSNYDPHDLFSPLFYKQYGSEYRSGMKCSDYPPEHRELLQSWGG